MKKYNIILGLLVLLVISSASVSALGVMPASKKMLVNELDAFELIIVNNDNSNKVVNLDVQGDLKDYIILSKTQVKLKSGTERERLSVNVKIPSDIKLKEGEHINYIIVSQQTENQNEVSANINLAFKLNVVVPYSGEALDLQLYITNFEQNKENNFALEAKNVGIKDVPEAIPVIDIYSATGEKVDSIRGERVSIKKGESKIIDLKWTPNLPNGKYSARAFLLYGEKTVSVDKIFSVGTPKIVIDSVSTYSFKLGGVASIDLIVSSNWVEPIDGVYASVDLMKGDSVASTYKTASKTISSLSKTNLPVFINTQGLEPGKYSLSVNLHYFERITPYTFDMTLTPDDMIIAGATGRVAGKTDTDLLSSIWFLTFVVFVFLGLNTFIIYKFVIKRKK